MLSTAARARMYERLAARGHATEASDLRRDIVCALPDLEHALSALKEAGVDVREVAKILHDGITNRDKALCDVIDAAGDWHGELDLTELAELVK